MPYVDAKESTGGSMSLLSAGEKTKLYALAVLCIALVAAASVVLAYDHDTAGGCSGTGQQRYSCLALLSAQSNNLSGCASLPQPYSDSCYYGAATLYSNASTCTLLSSTAYAQQCGAEIANATSSAEPCTMLNASSRSACLESFALSHANASACSYGNSSPSASCLSAVYLEKASTTGDGFYCTAVTNSTSASIAEALYENLSSSAGTGEKLAASLGPLLYYLNATANGTYSPRDLCYLYLAESQDNSSYCPSISGSSALNLCYYSAPPVYGSNATTSLNYTMLLSDCRNSPQYSQECVYGVLLSEAISTRNASICASLGAADMQSQCYDSLASAYNDTSYCGYIHNATFNSDCLYQTLNQTP